MRGRFAAVALVIVMLAICFVPFYSDDSDAVTSDEYKISMPGWSGTKGSNPVTLENGGSHTFTIYIQNLSSSVLDVAFNTVAPGKMIHGDNLTNLTLAPTGDKSGNDLLKQEYTLAAADVMPSIDNFPVKLVIRITDLTDDTYTLETIEFDVSVASSYDISVSQNKFLGIFDNNLPAPFNTPIVPFLVTLLVYIVAALVIMKVLIIIATRFMKDNSSDRERKVMRMTIRSGVFFAAAALFVDVGIRIIGTELGIYHTVHNIMLTIITVMVALIIWQIYSVIIDYLLWKLGQEEESFIDPTLLPIFSVVGKIVLCVGSVAFILHIYGMDLSGILLSAGIVTLGISLGAQSVLSQFFSGIVLLLTRPFNRGEYVEMNGRTFIVKRVKLMYTEFYGVEKDRVVTMPNNAVVASTIINMSKYDKAYRMYIDFEIPASLDVKKVEEFLLQLAEESVYVMHDDAKYRRPRVKFMDFKGQSVQLRLDATIRNFEDLPEIQSEMKRGLFVKLAEAGMEASYSKLKVSVKDNGPDAQGASEAPKSAPSE